MNEDRDSKYEKTKKEVIRFVAETLQKDETTIVPDSEINDLSNDSIQLFELLLAFENKYNVEVDYDDAVQFNTIEDVIQYVMKITEGK